MQATALISQYVCKSCQEDKEMIDNTERESDRERGKIQHREYARQLRDFTGLKFGNKTPTDLDAFMDFGGKQFVFIEAKFREAEVPRGQLIALERVCDASQRGGVESLLIICRHEIEGVDIDFANATVERTRRNFAWTEGTGKTVRQVVDEFRQEQEDRGFAELFEGMEN